MSSDTQRSITDYDEAEQADADDDGGVPAWADRLSQTETRRQCQHCGESISAAYHRHHKDENGDVHRCPECSTERERLAGLATDPDRNPMRGITNQKL